MGIGLLYRPARLHRLAESIPVLLKCLKIPSLNDRPTALLPAMTGLRRINTKLQGLTFKTENSRLVKRRGREEKEEKYDGRLSFSLFLLLLLLHAMASFLLHNFLSLCLFLKCP